MPAIQSKHLFDAAKISYFRQLYVVEGGTHNDTWRVGGETYKERLFKFMNESKVIMNKIREFNKKMQETTRAAELNSAPPINIEL